ncbi:HHL134Cp [Eremothecium sinecaudum]|uniref:HHL134Cp n=1 Tax=Eremothecium sinecaudum TaxID=45286 RepID=A0A109V0D9_9SACH|nr:HHL134Cp [Eremothecium sinecaudum]AMD22636.1 HHL134Cp [Eremothecium sinecaudum]
MIGRTVSQAKNTLQNQISSLKGNGSRAIRSFKQQDQPRLRINSTAPDFTAETTAGELNFYDYLSNSWGVLFSHPADFTPVCTTELGTFAKLKPEFDKRNVKLIGLSAEGVQKHHDWVKDIEEVSQLDSFTFPIIGDVNREVSFLYDMVDEEGFKNLSGGLVQTIRSVYVIDPSKKIRLIFTYPAAVGRNSLEVLRVIDALQKGDEKGVVTPVDWKEGDEVIIPPSVSDEDAKAKFGSFRTVKPYLRFTKG